MRKIFFVSLLILFIFFAIVLVAKGQGDKEVKLFLNESQTHWVKGTGLGQIWVRYTDLNPGSTIFETPKQETFDVGLRTAPPHRQSITRDTFFGNFWRRSPIKSHI